MDNTTKFLINSLTEDILEAYGIEVPIKNIDDAVRLMGGDVKTIPGLFE